VIGSLHEKTEVQNSIEASQGWNMGLGWHTRASYVKDLSEEYVLFSELSISLLATDHSPGIPNHLAN